MLGTLFYRTLSKVNYFRYLSNIDSKVILGT